MRQAEDGDGVGDDFVRVQYVYIALYMHRICTPHGMERYASIHACMIQTQMEMEMEMELEMEMEMEMISYV
jgi:hypothetical protein